MERHFDDSGSITLTTDFSYAEVDDHLGCPNIDHDYDAILECQRRVWDWVYQENKDLDGFMCRCIVVCWIFVPTNRAQTMTYIAGRFGKKKQSIGRWVDNFKLTFPEISKHLQHLRYE